jgi:hypothetical protein
MANFVDDFGTSLVYGPIFTVVMYQGYDINGYRFYTKRQDKKSTYQEFQKTKSADDCPRNVYSLVALKCNQASNVNDNQMLFCETMVI